MVRSTMVVGSSFCALKIELLRAFQTNQRVITSSSFLEETGARWSPLGRCRACRWGEVALKHFHNSSVPGSEIPGWFSQEVPHFAAPKKNRQVRGNDFRCCCLYGQCKPGKHSATSNRQH